MVLSLYGHEIKGVQFPKAVRSGRQLSLTLHVVAVASPKGQ